jgi:hypothetical protein
MLVGMSAYSSFTGTTMAGSWPMARVMAGMSAVPVGHAVDLAFFFPDDGRARHDALIAETRRHLGGCTTSIEMALRLALAQTSDVGAVLDRSPAPVAWAMIRAQPSLIGPALLATMEMRAAVTMMLRQFGQADVEQLGEQDNGFVSSEDSQLGDALSALALAEGRWLAMGGEDTPMKPDLPAEHFAELMWTVAACLTVVAQRTMVEDGAHLLAAVDRAGWALLADHDETACPIAQADRLVRHMDAQADTPDLLGKLLAQRRFLPFAAVAARRLRMNSSQVVTMLVTGPVAQVGTLCRALGGSDADYRHLLLALRPVRPNLTDAAMIAEADRYQALSEDQADGMIRALRTAPAFRAKLDHLRAVISL